MDATEEEKKKVCTEDDRKPGSALVVCPCSPEDRWSEKPVFRFCLMDGDGSWMDSKLADISVSFVLSTRIAPPFSVLGSFKRKLKHHILFAVCQSLSFIRRRGRFCWIKPVKPVKQNKEQEQEQVHATFLSKHRGYLQERFPWWDVRADLQTARQH